MMRINGIAAALGASVCMMALATPAYAQERSYDIPAGSLRSALDSFGRQSGKPIIYKADEVRGARSRGYRGTASADAALEAVLAGSGFSARTDGSGAVAIVRSGNGGAGEATSSMEDDIPAGEEIIVTGTLIRGVTDQASPLQIYKRDEILRSGAGTVDQFIEQLPSNFAGVTPDTANSSADPRAQGNRSNGATVNLRGLGPGTTLVLLNGRRLAPSGLGEFVDISMIPLAALDRVEILSDGASALYGSDAVGGVANFVLSSDFEGAESSIRYGSDLRGFDEWRASQLLGASWSSGRVLASYEFYNKDALLARDRDFILSNLPASSEIAGAGTVIPNQKRHSAFLTASQNVASGVELYSDLFFSHRSSDSLAFNIDTDSAEYRSTSKSRQLLTTVGAKADLFNDWTLDLNASRAQMKQDYTVDYVAFVYKSNSLIDSRTLSLNASASGTLASLPGGSLRAAVGANYRRESLDTADALIPEILPGSYRRSVYSAFGELLVPVVGASNRVPGIETLELSVAGRFDHYSDFGDAVTPKFGIRYVPTSGITLRSTYSESFRAPLLFDIGGPTSASLSFFPPELVPNGALTLTRNGGNPDLGPERSKSWTVGADYKSTGRIPLTAHITYYNIRYRDKIDRPANNLILLFLHPEDYGPAIQFRPTSADVQSVIGSSEQFFNYYGSYDPSAIDAVVDFRNLNVGIQRQNGIDLGIGLSVPSRSGMFWASGNATYILQYERQIVPTSQPIDSLDTLYYPVDLKLRAQAGWTGKGLSTSLALNHVDAYRDTSTTPATPIDSWTTVDATVSYEWGVASPLRGLRVSASIQNLLNSEPPNIPTSAGAGARSIGYDAANADPVGRFASLTISKRF